MPDYDEATYGEKIAEVYDSWFTVPANAEVIASFLTPLAKGRRVLELGIGTGRVALLLAQRGVKIHGIDASPAMVEKMRAKPGGADIPVVIGNFADMKIGGKFSLVYVVFNTFFGLLTQDEQVRCFQRLARRLAPDGAFVIEAFVPSHTLLQQRRRVDAARVESDHAVIDMVHSDVATQTVAVQHVMFSGEGIKMFPLRLRYAYPSELDLMARLAGMRLRERFSGWDRRPFNSESNAHVSIYELAPQPAVIPITRGKRPKLKIVRGKRGAKIAPARAVKR